MIAPGGFRWGRRGTEDWFRGSLSARAGRQGCLRSRLRSWSASCGTIRRERLYVVGPLEGDLLRTVPLIHTANHRTKLPPPLNNIPDVINSHRPHHLGLDCNGYE